MATIQAGLAKRYPVEDLNNHAAQVVPEAETVTGDVRPALRILLSAVAALLLISCANVAADSCWPAAPARQPESRPFAPRSALVAARSSLQLLARVLSCFP